MSLSNWERKAESAFHFLTDTDEEHARLRSLVNLNQELRKQTVAMGFEGSDKKAQEAKRQDAHNTQEYIKHIEHMQVIEFEYFHLHNRRERAQQAIDFFRTYSANQRNS